MTQHPDPLPVPPIGFEIDPIDSAASAGDVYPGPCATTPADIGIDTTWVPGEGIFISITAGQECLSFTLDEARDLRDALTRVLAALPR